MSADETAQYIYSHIEAARLACPIIDESVINAIAGYSQNTPRVINSIMTYALILGLQLKKRALIHLDFNLYNGYYDYVTNLLLLLYGLDLKNLFITYEAVLLRFQRKREYLALACHGVQENVWDQAECMAEFYKKTRSRDYNCGLYFFLEN